VTRVVVVGPYPPTADPAGAVTLAEVRALRAAGRDVLVLSPEPSAARADAPPTTRRGARRIASLVRGADVVVWVGAEPPAVVARVLRDVTDVRMHATATQSAPSRGLVRLAIERMKVIRAGAPTWVRSLSRRRP
jgi:hypothetical protein